MTTVDMTIPSDGSWSEITATSAMTSVYNKGPHAISMRLGAASTSDGFVIPAGMMIVVDETCYVRSQKTSPYATLIAVTR